MPCCPANRNHSSSICDSTVARILNGCERNPYIEESDADCHSGSHASAMMNLSKIIVLAEVDEFPGRENDPRRLVGKHRNLAWRDLYHSGRCASSLAHVMELDGNLRRYSR